MKVFRQSTNKFIAESLLVALLSAFIIFFFNYLRVENILRITYLEYLASFFAGAGIGVIYAVARLQLQREKGVTVEDGGIIVNSGTRKKRLAFDDIKSIEIKNTPLMSVIKSVKIKVATDKKIEFLYIAKNEIAEFLSLLPVEKTTDSIDKKALKPHVNIFVLLIRTSFLFFLCSACILPGVFDMVNKKSHADVWVVTAIIFVLFFLFRLAAALFQMVRYRGYRYSIAGDKIKISCGKRLGSSFYLDCENITAVYLSYTFISSLFNLYRINILTKGGGKGVIENNYFPFLLNKSDALSVISKLIPAEAAAANLSRPSFKTILPTLAIWLLPAILVIAVTFISSVYFLLLLLPIAAFIYLTFKNCGREIAGGHLIMQKGFIWTTRIYIPLNKVERADAFMTITGRAFKMTFMEIYLSGYRAVIFGGYLYKSEFDKIIQNINELS